MIYEQYMLLNIVPIQIIILFYLFYFTKSKFSMNYINKITRHFCKTDDVKNCIAILYLSQFTTSITIIYYDYSMPNKILFRSMFLNELYYHFKMIISF